MIRILLLTLMLSGCVVPREPAGLPSRNCPPLPMIAERPTAAEYKAWTTQVIDLYVQCAKGPK